MRMGAFRIMIYVVTLSMIFLVSGEENFCEDCKCENQECRLNNLKQRKRETLEELIGLFQRKLDLLHRTECPDCGPPTPSPTAALTDPPTPAPTKRPATCAEDYDCSAECNRQPDPAKADSTVLSCQGCCKQICADWQPASQCGKCGKKVDHQSLNTEIDLMSSTFDDTCNVCCEDLTGSPTAAPATCEDWAPDHCTIDTTEGLESNKCPHGRVLNPAFKQSTILDCDVCTQPTCTSFSCARHNMVKNDANQCNILLHPHVCCKPTCELFDCRAYDMNLDESTKTSTDISVENCCAPTCKNWQHQYDCPHPSIFDQSQPNTALPKNFDEAAGQDKCCFDKSSACQKISCPPGLLKCSVQEVKDGNGCSSADLYRKDICVGESQGGCREVHGFSLWGLAVWDCCRCEGSGHIPAFDDSDFRYHCLNIPEKEEHFYCPDGLCRITLNGMNYCITQEQAAVHGYDCDEEWQGGINAPADAGGHADFDHTKTGLHDGR